MNVVPPAGMTANAFAEWLASFSLDARSARLLGSSQNLVYEANGDGPARIARISVARHRTRAQVDAELAWITFLANRGLAVCPPMRSVRSQLCEERTIDGTDYLLSVFTKAPGRMPARTDLTVPFAHRLGQLVGQMHTTAIEAHASGLSFARDNWKMSRLLTHDMMNTSAPVGAEFRNGVRELIDRIDAITVTTTTFGLIHGDVNSGNCHIDGERVWIFDFDNCEYGYFVQDLVVTLYDTLYSKFVKQVPVELLLPTVLKLWSSLVAGYRATGPCLTFCADDLRNFFLLREAVIYIHLHRIFPPERLADDEFVAGMRIHIESLRHPLDFAALAHV